MIPTAPAADADGEWVTLPPADGPRPMSDPARRPMNDPTANGAPPRSNRTTTLINSSRPLNSADTIEPVPYRVRGRETFGTIAKRYYGSGRYARALWAANRSRVPAMEDLRAGDVIAIPPTESLDRRLIEAPALSNVRPDAEEAIRPISQERTERVAPVRPRVTERLYVVREIATPRSLARDFLGNSRRSLEILELNPNLGDEYEQILPGTRIRLPVLDAD